MRQFEFHDYGDGTSNGTPLASANITTERFMEMSSARAHAGRLAKKSGGPVDLALAGDQPWADRYITTAAASEHHTSGYRLERLDG